MQKSPFLLLLCILMSCVAGKDTLQTAAPDTTVQLQIDAVRQQYAPDKRVALFQVEQHGKVLRGETNMPAAKKSLLEQLQSANISYVDSIQVLPEQELAGRHQAVVTISVANLRSQPKHSAEMATQATMGTPLQVWKEEDSWYLVQTPDKYLAWVDGGGITLMNNSDFAGWQQGEKLLYTEPYGFAYAKPDDKGSTVSDLVYGDVMLLQAQAQAQAQDFYQVAFPDGRTGYVPASSAVRYKDWVASRRPTEENLVETSKGLLGLPYLWGGTSFKGVDCSGFTKTVYFMNGLVLPRDASQQVHLGELVDTSEGWQNMRPGDLLFFGVPAKEGRPERVVHVGMWIGGDQEFIHSSGKVRVSSMNPASQSFEESELKRFLRAKRISPQETLDLRTASLYE